MEITENAKAYHEKMFPDGESGLRDTDPEFIERFDNFAFDEVVNQDDLDGRTRFMAILAALLGCQGIELPLEGQVTTSLTDRREAAILTFGWRTTVLGTTIPAKDWITDRGK